MTNNCTQMRLLTTALLHDELDSTNREEVLAHIGECADCKAFYLKIRKLEELLKSAIPQVEIPSVKNEIMRKISETEKLAAIRRNVSTIRFNCKKCKRHFEAEPKHIGKKMKCPKCGEINAVPTKSTIAPKQVRPPSNIAQAKTGSMPLIGKNLAINSAATPLVGELPTVKEIQKIASEVRSGKPVTKTKNRRPKSQNEHNRRRPRPDRRYAENIRANEKSSNKIVIFGVSGVGLILVLILALVMFGGNGEPTTTDNTNTNVTEVVDEQKPNEETDPNFKPAIIVDKPTDDKEKEVKKEEEVEKEEPVEPLEILSTKLPRTEFYIYEDSINFGIQIKGGVAPYKFVILKGSLPKGLVFENGVIKGDIREFGEFQFTVQVTDANNSIISMDYSMLVYDELQIDIQIPKKMELNKEYVHEIKVTGGKKPYSCSIVDAYLPQGVNFDLDNFIIKGTPLESGPFFIELSFTDSIGQEEGWKHDWEIEEPEEPTVEKPEDKKDDKELPDPDDKVDNPTPTNNEPGLSQAEIRQLLFKYMNQARLLTQQKKYEEAIELYAKVIDLDDMNANAYYNTACLYSIMDNKDKAIEFLEAAIRAGYRDLNHILNDPDFDNIKRDKRFKKLTKNQDLINQLSMDAIKAKVDKEFPTDQGFLKKIDHENKLIFATNLGDNKDECRAILKMLEERIENYAKAQWRQLFEEKPKYYITVALPKKPWFDSYKLRKGFPAMVGGWYNPADKFLIAGTMGHTLTHEFTHAMHYADLEGRKGEKNMHIWFTEGIATCFEDCMLPERSSQKPEPVHNSRVNSMIRVLNDPKLKRYYWNWRKFFSQTRGTFMSRGRVGVSYSMSRCITLWLYRTKKLKKYYENYMDSCDNGTPEGRNGITAMEMTFKMKLEDIENEWLQWMNELEFDPPKAYIGIRTSNQPSKMGMGVLVSEVTEGGGAEEAGIKVGDIIVTFNRMAIDQAAHLLVAIGECKINQRVECVIIRDGKPMVVKVKLKKKPKGFS